MRKSVLICAAAAAVSILFAGCAAGGGGEASSSEVVVYSSEQSIDYFVDLFEKQHPDIDVKVVSGSSGELRARVVAEGGRPQGDVFWGGGDPEVANPELYAKNDKQDLSKVSAAFQDTLGYKSPIQTYAGIFLVNSDLLDGAAAPTRWQDLADPKWKGKIYFANPATSNAAYTVMVAWHEIGGWDLVKKIAQNLVITEGSLDPVRAVGNGEATIGIGAESSAYQWVNGDKITPVYPTDGMTLMGGPMYRLANSANEQNAITFIDFMLSADTQTSMSQEFQGMRPTNEDATASDNVPALDSLEIIPFPAKANSDRSAWLDQWKDIITSVG